jgi:hypothetical protein
MAAVNNYDDEDALALFDFHESCAGIHGLVESGVTKVPPPFLMHTTSISAVAAEALVTPSVDLTLPRSHVAKLIGATARSYGFFQLTNHGVPIGTVKSALSVVRAFNEQP